MQDSLCKGFQSLDPHFFTTPSVRLKPTRCKPQKHLKPGQTDSAMLLAPCPQMQAQDCLRCEIGLANQYALTLAHWSYRLWYTPLVVVEQQHVLILILDHN